MGGQPHKLGLTIFDPLETDGSIELTPDGSTGEAFETVAKIIATMKMIVNFIFESFFFLNISKLDKLVKTDFGIHNCFLFIHFLKRMSTRFEIFQMNKY